MTNFGGLQSGLRGRRDRETRQIDISGQTRSFGAIKPVYGSGEIAFNVMFPYMYSEVPLFTFGWSFDENYTLTPNFYPRVSVGVSRWLTRDLARAGRGSQDRLFEGARVAGKVLGRPDMRILLHTRFEGTSIVYPVANDTRI